MYSININKKNKVRCHSSTAIRATKKERKEKKEKNFTLHLRMLFVESEITIFFYYYFCCSVTATDDVRRRTVMKNLKQLLNFHNCKGY